MISKLIDTLVYSKIRGCDLVLNYLGRHTSLGRKYIVTINLQERLSYNSTHHKYLVGDQRFAIKIMIFSKDKESR